MTRVVAVLDPTPVYRDGLAAALQRAGFAPATAGWDPAAWTRDGRPQAVLLTVRGLADLDQLRELQRCHPGLVTVALLVDPTPQAYATALQTGATGAAAHAAPCERILATLAAALDGHTLLPDAVARELAGRWPILDHAHRVTVEEAAWLARLASGETVSALASETGYSERSMHRRLHDLYRRLGVSNRAQAVALTGNWGLLPRSRPSSAVQGRPREA